MGAREVTPALPPGFELEASDAPPLPPGFEVEPPAPPPSQSSELAKRGRGLSAGLSSAAPAPRAQDVPAPRAAPAAPPASTATDEFGAGLAEAVDPASFKGESRGLFEPRTVLDKPNPFADPTRYAPGELEVLNARNMPDDKLAMRERAQAAANRNAGIGVPVAKSSDSFIAPTGGVGAAMRSAPSIAARSLTESAAKAGAVMADFGIVVPDLTAMDGSPVSARQFRERADDLTRGNRTAAAAINDEALVKLGPALTQFVPSARTVAEGLGEVGKQVVLNVVLPGGIIADAGIRATDEGLMRGMAPGAALLFGTLKAATEGVPEQFGTRFALKQGGELRLSNLLADPKVGIDAAKRFGKTLGVELTTEQATAVSSWAVDRLTDDPTATLDRLGRDMVDAVKSTLVQAPGTMAVGKGLSMLGDGGGKILRKITPYDIAAQRGFPVEPPLTTDDPVTLVKRRVSAFQNVAAAAGIPQEAVKRAVTAAKDMPAEQVGPFLKRLVGVYGKNGLVQAEPDPAILDVLAAAPLEPPPEVDKSVDKPAGNVGKDAAVDRIGSLLGVDAIPASDLVDDGTGLADAPAAVTAAAQTAPATDAPEFLPFDDATGTLKIPRAEMPQIKAGDRSALVQFLRARGVDYAPAADVPATDLKPTQAEFSPAKVQQAREYGGTERSILVSADGYVIDGHHQWLRQVQDNEPVRVIRLDAPIADLLPLVREFPSAALTGATSTDATPTQSRADLARSGAELPADIAQLQAISEKGLGAVDVEAQPAVLKQVLRAADDPEIRQAVVERVPVDVMNLLGGAKASADALLNNVSVLVDLPKSGDGKASVSLRRDAADTFVRAVAGVAAERDAAGRDAARRPVKADVALGAKKFGQVSTPTSSDEPGGAAAATASPPPILNRVIGQVGITKASAENVELRPNDDGTLTPYQGRYPLIEFESGEPVTMPATATDDEAFAAIKASGALGRRTKVYRNQPEQAQADEPQPASRAEPKAQAQRNEAPAPAAIPAAAAAAVPDTGAAATVEALGVAPAKRKRPGVAQKAGSAARNPFKAFLGRHGISIALAPQFAPGQTERRAAMVPGYGPIFRKNGLNLDELAQRAAEDGFLPPGSEDATELYEMIANALRGERIVPIYAEGAAEADFDARVRREEEAAEAAAESLQELADDDLTDLDALWNRTAPPQSEADFLQAMGFTDQEIRDATTPEGQEGATSGEGDRGAAAPAAGRGEAGDPRGDEGAGAAEAEGLTSPTQGDLEASARRARDAEAADRKEQKRLADKAKADAERNEFTLTGSDRPADVAAAAGQGDIFAESPAAAPALPSAAAQARAFADDFAALAGRTLVQQIQVAGTGQTATLKIDAAQAMRQLAAREKTLRELRTCIGRAK